MITFMRVVGGTEPMEATVYRGEVSQGSHATTHATFSFSLNAKLCVLFHGVMFRRLFQGRPLARLDWRGA
jgi:hypothetical protein